MHVHMSATRSETAQYQTTSPRVFECRPFTRLRAKCVAPTARAIIRSHGLRGREVDRTPSTHPLGMRSIVRLRRTA